MSNQRMLLQDLVGAKTAEEQGVERAEQMRSRLDAIKDQVKEHLKDELKQVSIFSENIRQIRAEWRPKVREAINLTAAKDMRREDLEALCEEILQDIFGLGRLQPLLDDPTITDILIVGGRQVYVMRSGKKERAALEFDDPEEVTHIVKRIAFDPQVNRRIDESSPMLDARLPDGSRLHALIPPVVPDGPSVSIRKFPEKVPSIDDLVQWGSLSQEAADFLRACVRARLNILVVGGTGSGKTTLLNILSEAIPEEERIVTIEDSLELQIHKNKPHVVRMEARPPSIEGKGEIPIARLVKESLRMLPDRIVVGEVRHAEAAEMLNAMSTGHDGSMATVHANSPVEAIQRVIYLSMMSGTDVPYEAWNKIIAGALHLIVLTARLEDGTRRVMRITEVGGVNEAGNVELRDIFRFVQEEDDSPDGRIKGQLRATGVIPEFQDMFRINRSPYDWSILRRAAGEVGVN